MGKKVKSSHSTDFLYMGTERFLVWSHITVIKVNDKTYLNELKLTIFLLFSHLSNFFSTESWFDLYCSSVL